MNQGARGRRQSSPTEGPSDDGVQRYKGAGRKTEERRNKIVDVAIKLARGRGFEAIGLREVADEAGVALGTLYKVFSSKEEIIGAAVDLQTRALRKQFERRPAEGDTRVERLEDLFARLTRAMCKRPSYARVIIATVTADHPEIFAQILEHEGEMNRIVVAALRGDSPQLVLTESFSDGERQVTFLVRQIWFAGLVGWSGGLFSQAEVVQQVVTGAKLILAGAAATGLDLD
ncbi:MAG: TetR/AcrR family transcriptional regulator [Deltaproteobacteria bacterium]|nr:TetR/AcrR family transcriptional regulator [Deltaproteobacteria bacterium]